MRRSEDYIKEQEQFETPDTGGGRGSISQPKNKVDWVQWAIIGLIVITIALVVLL